MPHILIIDDDIQICETMHSLIARLGYECTIANTIADGLAALDDVAIDVVFLDIRLPDGHGLDALTPIKKRPEPPEVIILTGEGDPDGAELAIQGGVWDYLVKPTPVKQTTLTLNRALKYRVERLSKSSNAVALNLDNMVGGSAVMRECFNMMAQASSTDANMLITGETGTGKELTARTVHSSSLRNDNRFVVVDCASLTEHLVESTLFGHKKGAFTGAQQDRDGLVKLADQGTLFLDEVAEMPLVLQKSFLRFLQERVFRPVGSTQEIKSNFRLISATNKNLEAMVERGEFRKDLFFRLKTIHLELPALRTRADDLKPLTMFHINRLCERYAVPNKGFSSDFVQMLQAYDWPGNVRELFNVLERAFVASGQESMLYAMHLPHDIRIKVAKANLHKAAQKEKSSSASTAAASGKQQSEKQDSSISSDLAPPRGTVHTPLSPEAMYPLQAAGTLPSLKEFKTRMERVYLEQIIEETDGNVPEIVKRSGLSRSHFYALLKKNNMTLDK